MIKKIKLSKIENLLEGSAGKIVYKNIIRVLPGHLFLYRLKLLRYFQIYSGAIKIFVGAIALQLLSKSTEPQCNSQNLSFRPQLCMDSEDNLSLHSSNVSSQDSSIQSSKCLSRHLSSASSSSNGPQNLSNPQNNEQIDRYEDNTIGFDSFSDYSNNPLNMGFVANEDSFFSEYKSLYSSKSRQINEFSNSMDQNSMQNDYDSNSFNSFHSFVSNTQHVRPDGKRKGSRDRSREKLKRQQKSSLGIYQLQPIVCFNSKDNATGFKKRK